VGTLRTFSSKGTRSPPPPLGRIARPRALHQNLPHRQGGDGDEVGAVLELARLFRRHLQERLVDKGSGLQRLAGRSPPM
jgi:hypothetical protein